MGGVGGIKERLQAERDPQSEGLQKQKKMAGLMDGCIQGIERSKRMSGTWRRRGPGRSRGLSVH